MTRWLIVFVVLHLAAPALAQEAAQEIQPVTAKPLERVQAPEKASWVQGLEDWQTLMTGGLAVLAAAIAYAGVLRQVRAADRRHADLINADRKRQADERRAESLKVATAFRADFKVLADHWKSVANTVDEHLKRKVRDLNTGACVSLRRKRMRSQWPGIGID